MDPRTYPFVMNLIMDELRACLRWQDLANLLTTLIDLNNILDYLHNE